MEIEKNLVVSTAHATQPDMVLLSLWSTSPDSALVVYDNEYWTLVHLEGLRHPEDLTEHEAYCALSPGLRELLVWAARHEKNFAFLKLESDGPVLERFPVHEW